MTTERETLRGEIDQGLGGIRPVYGYYRLPNGWVKPAVMTPLEELKYRREGWEPLPQYGRFDMGTGYAASHPLELLFIMGGAHELSEEQVRQQGLYMYPQKVPTCRQALTQRHRGHSPSCWVGAKPVEFPQVAHMADLGPFPCQFCEVEKPTVEALRQHETVAHKAEKAQVRTGETIAAALAGPASSAAIASPAKHKGGRRRKTASPKQDRAPLT